MAQVQPGQKVLINGASGGVGTFAVQIAKALGAEVTGVTSTKNVEMVRSIGADHVIDYTQEDFTAGAERYDLILDNVGNHSMARTRRALTPDGTLISNGGGHADGKLGRTVRAMLASMVVRQQAGPTVKTQNHDDLVALKGLVEAGKVTPVIDRTYPLTEAPEAIGHVAAGHARGTVVHDRLTTARSVPPDPIHRSIRKEEHTMSKTTVTRLFIGSGIAVVAGALLSIAAIWLAIANDVFVMSGPDIVGIHGSALALVPARSRHRRRGRGGRRRDRRLRVVDRRAAEHVAAREQDLVRRPAPARDLQPRLLRDDRVPDRRAGRHGIASGAGRRLLSA